MAASPRRVLIVCTANVCRSYMAQVLMSERARDAGLDLVVTSAATRLTDLPVHHDTRAVLVEAGYTPVAHRPREIDRSIIRDDGADLVITMTRQQLRDVVATDRLAWPRVFTLREIVRRASALPAVTSGWSEWLGALGEGRLARDLIGDDPADDIPDPYGLPMAAQRECLALLRGLGDQVLALAPW